MGRFHTFPCYQYLLVMHLYFLHSMCCSHFIVHQLRIDPDFSHKYINMPLGGNTVQSFISTVYYGFAANDSIALNTFWLSKLLKSAFFSFPYSYLAYTLGWTPLHSRIRIGNLGLA